MPYVRHDYRVEPELIEQARKAHDWYETRGMKVATTPAIPSVVAAWIVRNCVGDAGDSPDRAIDAAHEDRDERHEPYR